MVNISCFHCHNNWTFELPLGRRDECPSCLRDAHVCLNCQHYDPKSHHECREPQSEFVAHKDRSNFCDYFIASSNNSKVSSEGDDAKQKLAALFKDNAIAEEQDSPQSSLQRELAAFLGKK